MRERPFARGMNAHRQTLDDDSASRMLQGLVHPDDAPPGYASVAGLLATAAQLPPLAEDAGTTTVSAMVETIRAGAPAPDRATSRRKSMLGKIFAGKALVAMATVALTATGAAAASGSLPAPVQDAVSEAVSHVGFDLPAKGGKSAAHRQDGAHRQSGDKGQSGDDHGKAGADPGQPAETDGESSGDNGKGAVISDLTHSPALEGQPKGPVVSDVASDGKSQAGDHGKPADDNSTDTGDDEGQPSGSGQDDKQTPPVTTGSKATGEERSGGRGKSGAQDN